MISKAFFLMPFALPCAESGRLPALGDNSDAHRYCLDVGSSCCSGESLRDPPEAFFSPGIESLCVGEYQVPGAHPIQHQQLMRVVLAGEIDHEDSGAADKADVREDMDHGSCGQLNGARRYFHDGTVHTMEELGDPLIGGFGLVQTGIGSYVGIAPESTSDSQRYPIQFRVTIGAFMTRTPPFASDRGFVLGLLEKPETVPGRKILRTYR